MIQRTFTACALTLALMFSAQAQDTPAADAATPNVTADKTKMSYGIGFKLGLDMAEAGVGIDTAQVNRGFVDGFAKKDPAYTREELGQQLALLNATVREKVAAEFKKLATENKAKSDKFLADNKAKRGIVALPSGIQYRVIEEGTGAKPTKQSEVTVHYRGSLSDGFEFDSSFARGQPVKFKVDDVLKGWQEILPLMRVGDHWQVFLPPEQAYGERGTRGIGPNEVLVFDIRLVDVKG